MQNPTSADDSDLSLGEGTTWNVAASVSAEARLQRLVADRLGVDASELMPAVSLADDLGADEMDLLEIAVALEEDFGVVLSDADLVRVRMLGSSSSSHGAGLAGVGH